MDNHSEGSRGPRAAAGALAGTFAPARPHLDLENASRWFARCLAREGEQRRLFPWIAVCFGVGIVAFFLAEGHPGPWGPCMGLCVCTAAAILLRRSPVGSGVAIGLAAVFAGFLAGVIRTNQVAAPALTRTMITPLSGFIESIEERPEGARLTLRVREVGNLAPMNRPRRVRVTLKDARGLEPGPVRSAPRLGFLRRLSQPGPAATILRATRISAGSARSAPCSARSRPVAAPQAPDWDLILAARVDEARNTLARRIYGVIGGPAGAVSAALVTGKRGFIEEATNDVLRAAGIYHIVSISGLHMVLAAGTFFWLARALMALSPFAALRWPVKKLAALVAMIGACAYCIFSGSEVATERSLIMTLVMFGAILVDRPALSLRNLAIAALHRAGARAGDAAWTELPDVVRRRAGADRRRPCDAPRPRGRGGCRPCRAVPSAGRVAQPGRPACHDPRCEPRDGAVRSLSFSDAEPARHDRQRARAAAGVARRDADGARSAP